MTPRRIAILALAAAVLAALVGTSDGTAAKPRLRAFGSCDALLAYAKRNGTKLVGPIVLPATPVGIPEAAEGARDSVAGVDYSTTNVQEAGVDEPDLVKTDGKTLFAIAQGKLHAVDVRGAKPRLLDTLQLDAGWSSELLLVGDRALVVSRGAGLIEPLPVGADSIRPIGPLATVLAEVDVSDPAALRLVRTLTVDGNYLTARLRGSTARVVIATSPVIPLPAPLPEESVDDELARARKAIAETKLANWLPSYRLRNERSGRTVKRALVGCKSVSRAPIFTGAGMITVLTIDLERGLQPVDSDAVMTGGETVYASTGRLYVATQRWQDPTIEPRAGVRTELHAFDTSDPDETTYRGSGSVPGYLLNQWSMSEHDGLLRVASTDVPIWWGGPQQDSESKVTVLDLSEGRLQAIGQVGGLGKGERITGVRFIGDRGYVVTFRQIDPLYVVDLSRPASPRVRGELKIPGFSAYLHPIGDDLLLGVGQDATDEGRVLGTQVAVFDVSDPSRPERLAKRTLGKGSSEAEWDHRAFLYWPATRLAVLPFAAYDGVPFSGAVGLRVGAGGIGEVGRVSLPDGAAVRRSVVVGDTLLTLSDTGIAASGLSTLASTAWLPLP